jgi:phosphopantetheine adenylyltransferase
MSHNQVMLACREERGYPPLVVIVVDVVADTRAVAGGKVSSTALREQDAQRMQQQAAGA